MKPFVVITARFNSKRLPAKNILVVGGSTLVERSITHAKNAGLKFVVSSDIPQVLQMAKVMGGIAINRPKELCDGTRHHDVIKHAVLEASKIDNSLSEQPVVLLQPTSPFRMGNIIEKCIAEHVKNPSKNVFSGRTISYAKSNGEKLDELVWDGCVAVFSQHSILNDNKSNRPCTEDIFVENEHINMLQIDTEEDYIQACILSWRISGGKLPFDIDSLNICKQNITPIVSGKNVTVVGRPDGYPIPQDNPVCYVNHCAGYDGGRADILFIVASSNIQKTGINEELRQVAEKAEVVVIRNFGNVKWLKDNLKTKVEPLVVSSSSFPVTTGCIACCILNACGAKIETVGFQYGSKRAGYVYDQFTTNSMVSDEIAIMAISSKERKNKPVSFLIDEINSLKEQVEHLKKCERLMIWNGKEWTYRNVIPKA